MNKEEQIQTNWTLRIVHDFIFKAKVTIQAVTNLI